MAMGVSDRREREQLMRKEVILESARKLFADKGYDATTVDAIAASAELGKGTIYSYFSGKEEIYLAMLDQELQILHDNMKKTVESAATATDALSNLYGAFVRHHQEHHLIESIIVQVGDQRFIRLGLLAKLRERTGDWVRTVGGIIQLGIDRNELVACDVEKMATSIIGLILGIIVQQGMGQIQEELDEYNQTLFQLVMGGIQKQP
jgi:AcrR family transcriptional regulator